MGSRDLGRCLVLGACLMLGRLALPADLSGQSAEADPPELVQVRFPGAVSLDEEELAAAIVNRETECRLFFCWWKLPRDQHFLNRRELPLDLWRLKVTYMQQGFRKVQVDTTVVDLGDNTAEVVFTIDEGRPLLVGEITYDGGENVDVPGLYEGLPLVVGERLNQLTLNAARDSLTSRLKNNGFARAEVDLGFRIPAESPFLASVFFDLYPGESYTFGPVTVDGAAELTPPVVRRMLPFQEGETYDQSRVFQGQRNLFGLDLIRHANFTEETADSGENVVPVRVEVNEGSVHTIRPGMGFTSAECFEAEARWTSRNFQGGGRRLQITGRVSNILTEQFCDTFLPDVGTGDYGKLNWLASAEFVQPYLFSSRNAFSAALFAERASVPDIFIREGVGLNLAVNRTTGHGGIISPFYRPQRIQLSAADVYFCAAYLVCDAEDIEQLQSPNWLSPIGLRYVLDRQDQPLNPQSGFLLSLDYEHAGEYTLSDYAYNRLAGSFSTYHQAAPTIVLAARLRGGWLLAGTFRELLSGESRTDIVHPEKRFFSGGANSVRGFAQNQLGPQNLSIGVSSLINPVGGNPQAACTPESVIDLTCNANPLDDNDFDRPLAVGGTLVTEANLEARIQASELTQVALFLDVGQVWDEAEEFSFGDLEFAPGAGLRLITPIGPIRFDVAYNFRDSRSLPLVTEQIREFMEGDDPGKKITTGDGREWFVTDALAALDTPVLYPTKNGTMAPLDTFSWQRFQLHLTIGQAF